MQAMLWLSQATRYTEPSAQLWDTSSRNTWTLLDSDFTLITEGCLRSRGAIESIWICTTSVCGRSRHLLVLTAHAKYYKRRTHIIWYDCILLSLIKLTGALQDRTSQDPSFSAFLEVSLWHFLVQILQNFPKVENIKEEDFKYF